jgi:phosphate transport system substrate-binding protein
VRSRLLMPLLLLLAIVPTIVSACGGGNDSSGGGTVTGAGSTFAAPLYDQLGSEFKDQSGTSINYQSVGSGAGVAQFIANTVDYGATDVALKDDEVKQAQAKGDPLNIPVAFGSVTVSYNLSGVNKGLKLDGATLADIYLGKIKKWNDSAIAGLNPGTKLPGTAITVVHRSDGSGTTGLFTEFLSDYSPQWKSQIGSDKEVKWPTGTGSKGNEGVAASVKQTQGAIGYVELAYALQNNFATASVKNKDGNFVQPTLASTSAAGEKLTVPADLRFSAINSPGAQAYPIASATFVLAYKDMCKAGRSDSAAKSTKAWFDYLLGTGQQTMTKIQYAQLPANLLSKAQEATKTMVCNGSAISG